MRERDRHILIDAVMLVMLAGIDIGPRHGAETGNALHPHLRRASEDPLAIGERQRGRQIIVMTFLIGDDQQNIWLARLSFRETRARPRFGSLMGKADRAKRRQTASADEHISARNLHGASLPDTRPSSFSGIVASWNASK